MNCLYILFISKLMWNESFFDIVSRSNKNKPRKFVGMQIVNNITKTYKLVENSRFS